MTPRRLLFAAALGVVLAALPGTAAGQSATTDDDFEPQRLQPDFVLVNLPTTLRLPQYRLAFRVSHRFTKGVNEGGFTDALSDAFGLDAGAQTGLELRFSPVRGAQVGVYRTSDKTVDFFGHYSVMQQGERWPVSITAIAAVEGTGNFTDVYSPSLGVSIARTLGEVAAVYLVPMWINNTNPSPSELVESNDTFLLGIGARVRLARGLYVVGEVSPRVSGFRGAFPRGATALEEGTTVGSFAVEKQVGGHVFQVNFSNAFVTTRANIARGAAPGATNWYLGFNISRKFY